MFRVILVKEIRSENESQSHQYTCELNNCQALKSLDGLPIYLSSLKGFIKMSIYRVIHREKSKCIQFLDTDNAAKYISELEYKGMHIVVKSDGYKGDRVVPIEEKNTEKEIWLRLFTA